MWCLHQNVQEVPVHLLVAPYFLIGLSYKYAEACGNEIPLILVLFSLQNGRQSQLYSVIPEHCPTSDKQGKSLCNHRELPANRPSGSIHKISCFSLGLLCSSSDDTCTFREMESVVEQYNRDLAEWERQTSRKPQYADKEQCRPPERERVLKHLHEIQKRNKQKPLQRQKRKSIDRGSR